MAKKLRDLVPKNPRSYYKGASDFMNGQMGSMKYKKNEIEKLFRLDPHGAVTMNLGEAELDDVSSEI